MQQVLFHPMLVHFPIAFTFLESIVLVIARVKSNRNYLGFAQFVFTCALISMPIAMISGSIDAGGIQRIFSNEEIREHFISAQVLFVFSVARFFHWKVLNKKECYPVPLLIALSIISIFLAVVTGKFGGDLVYES